jgi:pyruvate,water dikinase
MGPKIEVHNQYVLDLSDIRLEDINQAGAKAANEAQMLQAGFPVPEGFVLTIAAFERFLDANQIDSAPDPAAITAAPFPSDVLEALHAGAASFGQDPLAVRSSGIAEDLPGASFAGQYETILNVQGPEALEAAVRRCWASIFSEQVLAYRENQGLEAAGMAVLVQQMVAAEAAGVAFTANPVTGDRDEIVISAVRGLGERLVSGEASPDEWGVKEGVAQCWRAPEKAINADQALTIAEMAQGVEAHFGQPQDIEWARLNGQLFVLQARPITTLPDQPPEMIPLPVDPPPGFWLRNASHAPQPHTPMNRTLMMRYQMPATKRWLEEFGLLFEGIEFREIGGWEYIRLVPLGGKEGPALPSWLMWTLARLVPAMRARTKQAAVAMETDKPGEYIQLWHESWLPEQTAQIETLRNVELALLPDAALDKHLRTTTSFLLEGMVRHALLHGSEAIILYELVATCQELLDWDGLQAFELVSGTSYKSTEPARRLAELAKMAQERPAIQKLLEQIDEGSAERLARTDKTFDTAFSVYMREYGCRALRYEVSDPTLAETPELVLQLIQGQMKKEYDPAANEAELSRKRAELETEARQILAGKPAELQRFQRVLSRAEQAYPVREDNEFYTVSAPLALLRYALLELGLRLAERDIINQRDDVFFLEIEEAQAALLEERDYRSLVQRRQGERAWALAHPGPSSYGPEPGPPPSFDFLPAEARLVMESLLWFVDQNEPMDASQGSQASGDGIEGIAASPGQYTGPARIIMDESEFHKLQPGDVLVCPITSPVWSVLFPSIGALVTDTGAMLSHPAIIAREYQVPAVLALGNATSLLKDG